MSDTRLARAEALFHAARELEPATREAYLADRAGAEPELLELVRGLLAEDAVAHRLDSPAVLVPDTPSIYDTTPDRVGRYRIVRRIGMGGMGVVYEAEQENPRRGVAVKVLQRSTDEMRRRFEREAQFQGRLQHPAIAQIHEAGIAEIEIGGRVVTRAPFLAMELVRGEVITAAIVRRKLSIAARLELFARVCDGVHAAHVLGIVHRDLKPSNVLVVDAPSTTLGSREPVLGFAPAALSPKILDFGVARQSGASSLTTATGELLGTLAYMSPEQARGDADDVDTRSDVYSLGVMLHEILVGRRPLEVDGLAIAAAVRRIELEEPEPLGRSSPDLRGDISTIVSKALEKDPTRRYSAADEMAADIRRHLAHEPILAQPASAVYLVAKYARRHRTAFLATSGAVVALVGGLTVGLLRARAERDEALLSRNAAEIARSDAEAVTDFLEDVLVSANPEVGSRDVTLLESLDSFAPEIGQRFAGRPRIEARIRHVFGDAYRALGRFDAARAELDVALRMLTSVALPDDPDLMRARLDRAYVDIDCARYDAAQEELDKLLALEKGASAPDYRRIADVLAGLADAAASRGDPQRALDSYTEAVELRRRVLGPDHNGVVFLETAIAGVLLDLGRFDEAIPLLEHAAEHDAANLGPVHPRTLGARAGLGAAYAYAGRLDEAIVVLRDAVLALRSALGPEHRQTISTELNLATLESEMGRTGEARARLEALYESARTHLGESNSETLAVALALGRIRLHRGDPFGAEDLLCRAAATAMETHGASSWTAWLAAVQWCESLVDLGRCRDARAVLAEAASSLAKLLGPDHVNTRWAESLLAQAEALGG